MSKRKKYNSIDRLKANMKGAIICFDGDQENSQKARTAQGVPFDHVMLNYVVSYPWRWGITVSFIFYHGDLLKIVPVEFETCQAVLLNDLTDLILEKQDEIKHELGAFWEFKTKKWKAKIL